MKTIFEKKRNHIYFISFFIILYSSCNTTIIKEQNALVYSPNEVSIAYFNDGIRLNREHRYEESIISFTEAIKTDPAFQSAYIVRGNVFYILGRYSEAIQDYDSAINLGLQDISNYALAYYMKGKAYIVLNEFEKAIENYNQVLLLNPREPDAYHDRGYAYFNLERMAEAITDISLAINFDPLNYRYYNSRAIIFYKLGNYESALKDILKSLELNPGEAVTYSDCGYILKSLGHYNEALDCYNLAILLDSNFLMAYYGRAELYSLLADTTDNINERNDYLEKARDDYARLQ